MGVTRPLVSIITPTWQRPVLLAETIAHVREQDYRPIEHIVVSDGPDADIPRAHRCHNPDGSLMFAALGRNQDGPPNSFGIAPLTVGMLLARGEYQLWWSDDDRALVSDHITKLVDLLESSGAGFVYPRVRIWRNGKPDGPETQIIGTDPPRLGQITHFLYRSSLLQTAMPQFGTHPVDWALVDSWMQAGATGAMLPEVTYSHRLDQ